MATKLKFGFPILIAVSAAFCGCVADQLLIAKQASVQLQACLERHESEVEECDDLRGEANLSWDDYEDDTLDWGETWPT